MNGFELCGVCFMFSDEINRQTLIQQGLTSGQKASHYRCLKASDQNWIKREGQRHSEQLLRAPF